MLVEWAAGVVNVDLDDAGLPGGALGARELSAVGEALVVGEGVGVRVWGAEVRKRGRGRGRVWRIWIREWGRRRRGWV